MAADPSTNSALYGRAREREALGSLLAHATERGAARVIRGDPGVGKSALLDLAREQALANGFQVLATTGVESEAAGTPTFFLLLVMASLFGSSAQLLLIIIGLTGWMGVARVTRGEFLRWRRHLLPQAVPSLIVAATIGVSVAILTESGLSYLGLGVPPRPHPGATCSSMRRCTCTAIRCWPSILAC